MIVCGPAHSLLSKQKQLPSVGTRARFKQAIFPMHLLLLFLLLFPKNALSFRVVHNNHKTHHSRAHQGDNALNSTSHLNHSAQNSSWFTSDISALLPSSSELHLSKDTSSVGNQLESVVNLDSVHKGLHDEVAKHDWSKLDFSQNQHLSFHPLRPSISGSQPSQSGGDKINVAEGSVDFPDASNLEDISYYQMDQIPQEDPKDPLKQTPKNQIPHSPNWSPFSPDKSLNTPDHSIYSSGQTTEEDAISKTIRKNLEKISEALLSGKKTDGSLSYYHSIMFTVYDINEDGFISLKEWLYMHNILDGISKNRITPN